MAVTAILSALAQEQRGLLALLKDPAPVRRAGRDFWIGTLHGEPVVLALSRIGKVAAATTATALIEAFSVDRIVFTGVAGALAEAVNVGDLVVATEFVQHDMDASPLFARFEVPLYGQARFACDTRLTALLLDAGRLTVSGHVGNAQSDGARTRPTIHQGLVTSGDRFVSTAQSSMALRGTLRACGMDPLAVEMEGAAVAQVCLDYGVPFAAVRTISDRADAHASSDFEHFITHVAGHYALTIVDHFMRALAKQ